MATASEERMRRPPQVPQGTSSTLSGLTETFSFHSSPESFIASRVLAFQAEQPEAFDARLPIRAKVLNRNVAVISSHAQIAHILAPNSNETGEPAFVAAEAYEPLMADFFPSPNVLLTDGLRHDAMREPWEQRMSGMGSKVGDVVSGVTFQALQAALNTEFDIYEFSKRLVWKILLGLFLGLNEADPMFSEIERLQEDLLRGQFSLFPVSINVKWWQSPRSKGIAATEKLKSLIFQRLQQDKRACPFHSTDEELREVANHVLLFTSSLAVKAIASLMTPFLLNLFLFRREGTLMADKVSHLESQECADLLRSIMLETERLSPPIVGIMRKATCDTILPSTTPDGTDVMIPKGWDVWLYFVGGGRDPSVFGPDWAHFQPDRYLDPTQNAAHAFAFSLGDKRCLGQDLVREICVRTGQFMLRDGLRLVGDVRSEGVRAWLGWEGSVTPGASEWAKDMKQLPTQRPAQPIKVRLTRKPTI
jgi:cytochrome P450